MAKDGLIERVLLTKPYDPDAPRKECSIKKIIALLSIVMFAIVVLAFAAKDVKQDLRPAQKIMQARLAWLTAISKNLGEKKFVLVAKDADELAAQTKKVGDNLTNSLAKDITLAISSYAKDISAAATAQDGETVKIKLADIKGKCGECHAKIRDKK